MKHARIAAQAFRRGFQHRRFLVRDGLGSALQFARLLASRPTAAITPPDCTICTAQAHAMAAALASQFIVAAVNFQHGKERVVNIVSANGWDASADSLSGFPVCWVNRDGGPLEELGATPALVVSGLAAMADCLLE